MTTSTASVGSTLASMTSVGQLNVSSIVSALMTVAQQPITNLQTQISSYQTQLSAYGTLSSSLTTFQSALSSVSTATNLSAQTVSFTDSTSLSATSDGTATNASYDVSVSQVAKSQKLASADFANTTDVVGTGTININFGTYDSTTNTFTQNTSQTPLTVNITSANNTLSGIRDAINAQNAGVTASIVNDGTGNRLVLTSNSTGASNSMQITTTDSDGNNTDSSGLSALAYDPTATSGAGQNLTQMQAAQDAKFTVDGMAITKPSNTVTDVIAGVTLNIKGTTSTTNTMSVATDQTSIENSVQSFVTAYNTLNSSLSKLTYYAGTANSSSTPSSTSTSSNGSLFGDTTTNQISYKLKSMLNQVSPTATTYKTLTDIGVTMGSDGSLTLDKTKLDTAISTNLSDIAKIFAPSATSTSSQISYGGSTSGTQSGTYAVNITQAAGSGQSVVGTINGVSANGIGSALTSPYSTTNPSTGLTLNINGSSTGAVGSVTFSQGLAGSLNSLINQFIDPTSGLLTNTTNSVQTTITGLNTQVSNLNAQLPYIQAAYEQQYSSLNALLSSMSTTSSYVSAQLSSLSSSS